MAFVICPTCGLNYDDAALLRRCPHDHLPEVAPHTEPYNGPINPDTDCVPHEATKEDIWDLGWNPIVSSGGEVSGATSKYCDVTYSLDEVRASVVEKRFRDHTKSVGTFLSELYAVMVDPLADGTMKVGEMCATLLDVAKRQREADQNSVRIPHGELSNSGYAVARSARQAAVFEWALAAFGEDEVRSVPHRAIRFGEEAFEGMQAAGVSEADAERVLRYVYRRPPGELRQELGGIAVTLLCLAAAAGLDADVAERAEVERVLSKPLEHFRERNQSKNDAGLVVGGLTDGK